MKVFLSTHFGSLISEWLVLAVTPVLRRANSLGVRPFGVNTFVQVHQYRVLSLELPVKHTLHVTMSPYPNKPNKPQWPTGKRLQIEQCY